MLSSQFKLLAQRRFLPLFLTQALGAFNDNLFKNALVILITFRLAQQSGIDGPLLVTAAAGIFILPFFLFSAFAGQLADRYDKALLIRRVKLLEILLMGSAAVAFELQSVWILMGILFLMGGQSALFGPLKYGILPDHLRSDELIGGNGLIQAATFIAILLGTLVGGLLILTDGGSRIISAAVVAMALLGWFSSRYIPPAAAGDATLRLNFNIFTEAWTILRYSARRRQIFIPILGNSWFWLIGATFLAQVPNFAKESLGGDEQLVTLLLLLFSVGIGLGSLLCNRLLKGEVHATYVPWGALGISLFAFDLYLASGAFVSSATTGGVSVQQFLGQFSGWRILLDVLFIALSGGIYIVPLNTLIQARSDHAHLARNIASMNILNSLFMVLSAVASMLLLAAGVTVAEIFLSLAIANLAVVAYSFRIQQQGRVVDG